MSHAEHRGESTRLPISCNGCEPLNAPPQWLPCYHPAGGTTRSPDKMGCAESSDVHEPPLQNGFQDRDKSAIPQSAGYRSVTAENVNGKAWMRSEQEVPRLDLTEEVVRKYLDLEKRIRRFERANVLKKFESKQAYSEDLKKVLDSLEASLKEHRKQTEKELADVENLEQPTVKDFLKQQGTFEAKFSKEQKEYLNALNAQEVAEMEMRNCKKQYDTAKRISSAFKDKADELTDLYDQQDKMLAGIFSGRYGSDMENQLEMDLDGTLEMAQRISLAKFKWTNARVLVMHGLTQMSFGKRRWVDLAEINESNTRMRYFAAVEARNNFIAASQNIQTAQVYLGGNIEFPYCTPFDLTQLNVVVNDAFSIVQDQAEYEKSKGFFDHMHQEVGLLVQWFDQVINEKILVDLANTNTQVSSLNRALGEERFRLISERCSALNIPVDFDDDESEDDELEAELEALEAEAAVDTDELVGTSEKLMTPVHDHPPLLPQNELADKPNDEALFGNIAALKRQLEADKARLADQEEVAKAKMAQGLQDKLAERRQRVQRKATVSDMTQSADLPGAVSDHE